jgi:hypothetical protein
MTDGPQPPRRGYLDPQRVVAIAFWVVTTAILVAVLASILAIWKFTGTDALWRTVATCVVVGAGTVAFAWLNALFGGYSDEVSRSSTERRSETTTGSR